MDRSLVSHKGPYTQIGLGAAVGLLAGLVTMKLGKLAAIVVGSGIILLEIAQIEGLIHLDWSTLPKMFEKSKGQLTDTSSLILQARDFAITNMTFTVAFVGGTFFGIGLS